MKELYNVVRAREIETGTGRKTIWDRVGILLFDGDRISIRLDAIPAGQWDGWLKAFPRDMDSRAPAGAPVAPPANRAPAGAYADIEEDIPF